MKTRDIMVKKDENLSWCKPYVSEDSQYALAVCEGKVAGMVFAGKEVESDKLDDPSLLKRFAKNVNPYFSDYSGWDDLHIALERMSETACRNCPWFDVCEAMEEDIADGEE